MTRKDLAISLCLETGQIIKDGFQKPLNEIEKSDKDFTLEIDLRSEEIIIKAISKKYPNDTILSEERDLIKGVSGFKWIIDPLDGTVNYKQHIPYFCSSVSIQESKELVFATVFNPLTKELFYAEKNKGCCLNKQKIKVSSITDLSKAFVSYSTSHHINMETISLGSKCFYSILENCRTIRLRGSSLLDFCNLAKGVFDGLVKFSANYWDFAAGSLIVEEAGGRVTNFKGERFSDKTKNILASNNLLHNGFLKMMSN